MDAMLNARGKALDGATVVVSGSGYDAIYANKKVQMLGAKVVAMSDSAGYIHDPDGIPYGAVKELTIVAKKLIGEYVNQHPGATYVEGYAGTWDVPCDIAILCATRGEMDEQAAAKLVGNGCKRGRSGDSGLRDEPKQRAIPMGMGRYR